MSNLSKLADLCDEYDKIDMSSTPMMMFCDELIHNVRYKTNHTYKRGYF